MLHKVVHHARRLVAFARREKSVAGITAKFNKAVRDLQKVQQRALDKHSRASIAIQRHKAAQAAHLAEHEAAVRVAGKIRDLVA